MKVIFFFLLGLKARVSHLELRRHLVGRYYSLDSNLDTRGYNLFLWCWGWGLGLTHAKCVPCL